MREFIYHVTVFNESGDVAGIRWIYPLSKVELFRKQLINDRRYKKFWIGWNNRLHVENPSAHCALNNQPLKTARSYFEFGRSM